MKNKIIPAFSAIVTVVLIAAFELVFVAKGKYEIVAKWVQYYSRTISLISVGILLIIVIIRINGFMWKNDDGKKGIYPQTIIGILLIVLFIIVKVKNIWNISY